MIVGPRYNDVDPAVEAAYQRAAEAETCGHPEGCCNHAGSDEHGCWDCRNTGHTHETEPCASTRLDGTRCDRSPGHDGAHIHETTNGIYGWGNTA